ncbi:Cytochrome oxidase assembly protein ShyY1 [Paramicrobacterium humi]|uniref:SURF1-like protein n=1 Tax=Paramicrobacterium humi TaxID=640635 RepID=A0A1H4IYE4_9MICO|nr:SURF1 family cytochrome oxidase biogenesis protein [Microbacterium humi]SEB39063.1 Cytochrome oxidase assembly protein ShyY1 [Microbacterium humi]
MSTISRRDPDQPVTLLRTMLSARWLALLVLALLVAAAFAALGKWQLERAYRAAPTQQTAPTETVMPIGDVVKPRSLLRDIAVGQRTSVDGTFEPKDYIVIADRINGDDTGYWVSGHLVTDAGDHLAVALGWTATREKAVEAAERLNAEPAGAAELTGRVLSTQFPEVDEKRPFELTTMAVAALANRWHDMADGQVYEVYLVSAEAPAGLETIDAPPPAQDVEVNWLNIFYAVEWVVFAGFAVFLWYRLAKDSWERAEEVRELAASENQTTSENVN